MRSWLYCPGDSPDKMVNAGVYGADGIVLDLEDAVAPADKEQARLLVSEAVASHDFGGCSVAVRINAVDTKLWEEDLRAVVKAGARIIRVPKVETADAVASVLWVLDELEDELGLERGSVRVQAILETPMGVENAFVIAGIRPGAALADAAGSGREPASVRVDGLSFGAEDYCAAVGLRRPGPDFALDYPRSRIAAAAGAAGIECYDTVWSAFKDNDGLRRDAERARDLGFSGKSVIHPGQVSVVNEVFSPTEEEIARARRVLETVDGAGTAGATAVDGFMVDAPVIQRARRILGQGGTGSD